MGVSTLNFEDLPFDEWPDVDLIEVFYLLGDKENIQDLVRRIDNNPIGPAIFAIPLSYTGTIYFDLADTPNFKKRLSEASVDLSSFRHSLSSSSTAVQASD